MLLVRSVIADCERALDMRSSYHAAVAAAAAVTVTAMLISHHHRSSGRQRTDKGDSEEKRSSGKSLENGCVSAIDSGSRGSNSTRFPWEPAAMATASGIIGDDGVFGEGEHVPSSNGEPQPPTSRNETKSTPPHHRPQKDQLDFLASMTFASSGLRQPNCPCCI